MRFAEGLPSRGLRPLTPGERARLEDARARAGQKAAFGVLLPVLWLGVGALLAGASKGPGPLQDAAAFVVATGLFVGVGAGVLVFRDGFRSRRAFARDLASGLAEEFAGAGDGPVRHLVVLPGSSRLLERDGLPVRPARPVLVGDVAPAPASGGDWAMPSSALPEELRRFAWTKRPFTPEERRELEARVKALRRGPWVLAAFTGYAAFLLPQTLGEAELEPAFAALRVVFWVAVLGFGWRAFFRRRRLATSLGLDLQAGLVARATRDEAAGLEVLPASGAHWSKDGRPAAWRVAASRGAPVGWRR